MTISKFSVKTRKGLHGKFKIIGQVGLGLIVGLTLYLSPNVVIRENVEIQKGGEIVEIVHKAQNEKSTKTTIPFFKNNNLDYADFVGFLGDHAQTAGWILFVLVTIFVVTAVSKWCQFERWHGWNGSRKLRHHRSNTWNSSICVQSHRIRRIS